MDIEHFFANILRQRRGPEKMDDLEELQKIVTQQAIAISERAVIFAKKLFTVEDIRNADLLSWKYYIPNPSNSQMCSQIMGGPEGGASFRCY